MSAWPAENVQIKDDSEKKYSETYYDLLKVDRGATIAEIVTAYHAAKGAFSKDSVATYSLFNPEEIQEVLSHLEEAYLTLSNLEKRAEYDKRLDNNLGHQPLENAGPQLSLAPTGNDVTTGQPGPSETLTAMNPDEMSGTFLKGIRERRNLSMEDVARITKIPSKFLQAIENDDLKRMPARVYIQGFVKNLAALYKLDSNVAAKAYMAFLDKLSATTP